jgi:hypothetical protein
MGQTRTRIRASLGVVATRSTQSTRRCHRLSEPSTSSPHRSPQRISTNTTLGEHPDTLRSGTLVRSPVLLLVRPKVFTGVSSCLRAGGMAGGGPKKQGGEAKYTETKFAKQGDLGSKVLPYSPTGVKWKAGGTGTTKWSIRSNHGGGEVVTQLCWVLGCLHEPPCLHRHAHQCDPPRLVAGYSFRLCKRSEELTEACMQRTPLKFATDFHRLEFNDGTNMTIAGRYVSTGTKPAGSQWAMNPLPYTCPTPGPECSWEVQSFEPPCPEPLDRTKTDTGRCSGRDPFNTLIVDEVSVPANLEPGEYVLGIRWDCEKSAQICERRAQEGRCCANASCLPDGLMRCDSHPTPVMCRAKLCGHRDRCVTNASLSTAMATSKSTMRNVLARAKLPSEGCCFAVWRSQNVLQTAKLFRGQPLDLPHTGSRTSSGQCYTFDYVYRYQIFDLQDWAETRRRGARRPLRPRGSAPPR